MITLKRTGRSRIQHDARIAWLKAHPEAWADAPSDTDDVTDENRHHITNLEALMIKAGLLRDYRTANRRDTIRRLIGELRDR